MKTLSFAITNANEVQKRLQALDDENFKYELAFVFSTPRADIQLVSEAFANCRVPVVGSSTGGNILVDNEEKVIYEDTPVVTLVDINSNHFAYLSLERGEHSSFDLGMEIGEWGSGKFSRPNFIVVACGLSINGEEFVNGILEAAGKDTQLFGGIAGDETKFEQNYVFTRDKVMENGAIAIAFDADHIDMKGIATSG